MHLVVVLFCIAVFLGTGLVSIPLAGRRGVHYLVYGASLLASAAAMAAAIGFLIAPGQAGQSVVLPLGLPWIGATFRIDPLAAFFLAIVNLGGAGASFYALGYGAHETAPHRVLPFFAPFLAAMSLVVLADDAFTFLFCWELMSLSSWALVMAHHRQEGNAGAGYLYLLMATFGTLALLLAFGLLAGPAGGYGFEAMRTAPPDPLAAAIVLGLALLGAGSKAGLAPLHIWLPLAHPAAPSHVSALMSGVMTKVAIYGFVRIVIDLLGPPAWWWSVPVLALGTGSAVFGILHALMQTDLKRLLAYSTIENVGVVFIGLGLAIAFTSSGMPAAAALALTAGLFHGLNHAVTKSLLFFGAGAVLTATRTRNIEALGGLIRAMPATGLVVLIGAMAISALPPLNGFVSEWLTFQAVLQSPQAPFWGLKIMVPGVGALLALAAALAAACFVRAYGVAFLGRPRTPAAELARDVDPFSLGAMAFFAFLCVLGGVLPGYVIDAIAPIPRALVGEGLSMQAAARWLSIVPITDSRSSYNGLLVLVFVTASASFAALVIHRFASHAWRRGPAWDCGFPDPSPLTQYSGASFSQPVRRVFGSLIFHMREHVEIPSPGDASPARWRLEVADWVTEGLYAPIGRGIGRAADRLNSLQFLTIRRYLGLVFLALITLLLVLALWP